MFHVVLFYYAVQCKLVLTSKSVDKTLFHVVLFIMLYKLALSFKSVDETRVCDHSN